MHWLLDLLQTGSVAGSVLVLALVASVGLVLGSVRVGKVDLGVAGVLFAGLVAGHLGARVTPELLEFARDFGLVLFVYAIGVQVGDGFLDSLRRQGVVLNAFAVCTVVSGVALAVVISLSARIDVPIAAGMLAGATTNTPSLGAAQAALRDLAGYTPATGQLPGLGYAVAYPFGIVGVLLAMVVARPLFGLGAAHSSIGAGSSPVRVHDPRPEPEAPVPRAGSEGGSLQVLPIFLGIALGVVIGSIPAPVRGLPAPLRLGLAGGPLVVAIALSSRERIAGLTWRMPVPANALLRELGIILFLACVGLMSGGRFVDTLVHGDGLRWMAWATLITFLPVMGAALVGRFALGLDYGSVTGMMAGSMTDPPALAFATASARSEATTVAYATVYPLTMVLRILSTQVMVLVMMR